MTKLQIWLLAARPKTLPAALMPVFTASALAWKVGDFNPLAAFLCLMFALLAQIAANFANDYFDYKGGVDTEERLGPARAVASGWVKPKVMLRATFIALGLACLFGIGLISYGGWNMVLVGLACVVFACLYSTGPYPLSRYGMGDIFVVIFFGFVPVLFTYYVQAGHFTPEAWLLGAIMGLLSINILISNNYRDVDTDRKTNKYTTIVLFGKGFGKSLYAFTGVAACLLSGICYESMGNSWIGLITFPFLYPHFMTLREMARIDHGRELNKILGQSSRNFLLFGLLFVLGLLLV
ncbi:1,4-dihydroxy-2-naphthoate polyprenyltransferase [Parabacteroides sp. FAFU027]|uniref:1,4-dihydroxy-2-naphthoate polyprenyltransferase n=1 Tax=Parabacteroides sp. FAFU027 TaxID=2922715 RepID=UPI001FAFFB61|nr:1,4-dihydroxy-2-naphthoate polyprenyltransferase [Parabacteroides sp. FAFU027]